MNKVLAELMDQYGKIVVYERDGDEPAVYAEPLIDGPERQVYFGPDAGVAIQSFAIRTHHLRALADWVDELEVLTRDKEGEGE